jgi:hypothetical protein
MSSKCLHCNSNVTSARIRNLCRRCWEDKVIRDKYPTRDQWIQSQKHSIKDDRIGRENNE